MVVLNLQLAVGSIDAIEFADESNPMPSGEITDTDIIMYLWTKGAALSEPFSLKCNCVVSHRYEQCRYRSNNNSSVCL